MRREKDDGLRVADWVSKDERRAREDGVECDGCSILW